MGWIIATSLAPWSRVGGIDGMATYSLSLLCPLLFFFGALTHCLSVCLPVCLLFSRFFVGPLLATILCCPVLSYPVLSCPCAGGSEVCLDGRRTVFVLMTASPSPAETSSIGDQPRSSIDR